MKRVFAFIGFSIAITLIVLNLISFRFSILIILISAVMLAASLLIKRIRQAAVLPILFGSIVFACLIFITVNTNTVIPVKALDGQTVKTQFQVVDIPEYSVYGDYYTYTVKTKTIDCIGVPQEIKLKVKTRERLDCDYYDTVTANLRYYNRYDKAFSSYGQYGDGIYINATLKDVLDTENTDIKPLNYYFIKLRSGIIDLITERFKGDTAGVSIALLTGDKSFLSEKTANEIRYCGLSHFLAVSGFHISLICLGLYSLLKLLKVPKAVNTAVSLLAMVVYCGIADFSSSAVRSCIMLAVVLLSRLFNTKSDSLNSLGFSVFLICLNPFAVADVSAFLTVSAMLGILVIFNSFKKEFNVKNKYDLSVLLSACVLLSVIPAAYIFFGNMSVGSVFLNLLVEPIIIVVIVSVLLFCAFSAVSPIAYVLGAVINALIKLLLNIISFTSNNFSIYGSISGEIFGICIAGIFLFIGIMLLVKKKVPVKATALFSVCLLCIGFFASLYQQNTNTNVYIDSSSMVIVYDKDSAIVAGMNSSYDKSSADIITNDKDVVYIDSDLCADNINIYEEYSANIGNMQVNVSNGIITLIVLDKVLKLTVIVL